MLSVCKTNRVHNVFLTEPTNFALSISCRENLAKTSGLPACSTLDLLSRHDPCELRDPQDTRALYAIADISGDLEVGSDDVTTWKHFSHYIIPFLMRIFRCSYKAPLRRSFKVIHKEYSRFLNQFPPTPCLYRELNMIIHTSYINI